MICFDLYKNLNIAIKHNTLNLSPCCISPTRSASTVDFVNNPYLADLRSQADKGTLPLACRNCVDAEEAGLTSRRQGSNVWFRDAGLDNADIELVRLDYWTGDTCNLACVICGPNNSSSWKQELGLPIEERKSVSNKFWKTLDLTKIRFIHFNGGEPLLSKEHVEFLQAVPDKKVVHLNYNTNGSVLPSQQLLDLWSNFKLVQLDFSIDDIEQRFEYQRYPAKWLQVVDNLAWFIANAPHNCMFATNTSVGILNQSNIDALTGWLATNFHTSRFTDPIEHRQQLTFGLFASKDADNRKNLIINTLEKIDLRRGTDWRTTFPELDLRFRNL
jgi:sulfatase maturation enzyme AslB (radical SAM superfamily)